jgi:hypothetical protein
MPKESVTSLIPSAAPNDLPPMNQSSGFNDLSNMREALTEPSEYSNVTHESDGEEDQMMANLGLSSDTPVVYGIQTPNFLAELAVTPTKVECDTPLMSKGHAFNGPDVTAAGDALLSALRATYSRQDLYLVEESIETWRYDTDREVEMKIRLVPSEKVKASVLQVTPDMRSLLIGWIQDVSKAKFRWWQTTDYHVPHSTRRWDSWTW